MKPSRKQVSILKNTKNKKVSEKKVLKLVKSVSKKKLSRTLKSTKSRTKVTKSTNIIKIQENEYKIHYNTYLKYPELVIEPINSKTGTTLEGEYIDRTKFRDPFLPSPKLELDKQHTWGTYLNSMFYGFSPGHNAPAGNHKTSLQVYNETFLLFAKATVPLLNSNGLSVSGLIKSYFDLPLPI